MAMRADAGSYGVAASVPSVLLMLDWLHAELFGVGANDPTGLRHSQRFTIFGHLFLIDCDFPRPILGSFHCVCIDAFV